MVRTVRRTRLALGLPAVVGASTLLHWLAGRRLPGLWIMPDEAIYAARAEALWQHVSLPVLHGSGAGYGLVYPLLAGLPLSVGDFATGYGSLKLLQALVMSLTAVPVFLYGRRVMQPGYALAAAALTVASPLLLYSGLVMTEVLFYPLSALSLLAIARAVETSARRDQVVALLLVALAIGTRVQAVVFVAVFAVAIVVDALLRRTPSRVRAFGPVWLLLAVAATATAAAPGLFGAYAGTLSGGYPLALSLQLTYYHLAYAVLMVGAVPVAAALVLAFEAVRGRERDPAASALVTVALCTVALVAAQVGFFAARYAPHLLGRDLAALPPLLFLVLALWTARGRPQRWATGAAATLVVLAAVVFAPWNHLVVSQAFPDTFGLALISRLPWGSPADVVAVGAAAVLGLFMFVPRRLKVVLPAIVLAFLVLSSVLASNMIAAQVQTSQSTLVGTPANWVDRAIHEPAAYVFSGTAWPVVWQQRFWNRRITKVVSLVPSVVPGPMTQTPATVFPDGVLPIRERYVVASARDSFVGQLVARQSLGPTSFGLGLWRLDGPARLSTVTAGIKPNGDIIGSAQVTVYNCGGGVLSLTLLPKETRPLEVDLDGTPVLRRTIGGLPSWYGTITVPRSAHGARLCVFTLRGGPLLGSTVIDFARPS